MEGAMRFLFGWHTWTPWDLVLCSVALTTIAAILVDWAFLAATSLRLRMRHRRVQRAILKGGLFAYADPARIHRETWREVDRLASEAPTADAGTDRGVDARRVAPVTGLHVHSGGQPASGLAELAAGVPRVPAAPSRRHLDRRSEYGHGTSLVSPPAPRGEA